MELLGLSLEELRVANKGKISLETVIDFANQMVNNFVANISYQ